MPAIPAVDSTADYQFVSRSAGNTPEKIKAALEGEGIFIKDISEQTDDVPVKVDEPASQPGSEATPASGEPSGEPAKQAEPTEEQKAETARKAAPGVKERLKQKVEALTSESTTVKAELQTERQKREALEREIADLKAGKSTPSLEPPITPATVETTAEKPAEPKPRPKRPAAPKEEDFWEKDDPAAAYKAAQSEHETALEKYDDDLTDWRLDERDRVKRETEAADRQKEATENFKATNEADQRARVDRWKTQASESEQRHPDFKEKLGAAKPFTEAMIEAAHAMDQTAEIGYFLATHPEDADRIGEATKLPKNPTQSQINKAMKVAFTEYAKIEAKLAEEAPPADEDEDEDEVTQPVATPVKAAPVAAAPAPKKFTPVTPLGGRGGKSNKTLAELQKSSDAADLDELRQMPQEEYRRRQKQGT